MDDASLIDLIARRVNMKDCIQNGWVLDGFPQTRQQSVLMVKKGLNPLNVFHMQLPVETVYERTAPSALSEFSCDRTILSRRINHLSRHQPLAAYFFQKHYNSLTVIDGLKSRWFVETLALEAVEKCMKARLEFSRDFFYKEERHGYVRPCIMENMNYDRVYQKKSLSQYGFICPVTWRQSKSFVNCCQRPELTVLYQERFYYFAGKKERAIFMKNPKIFTEKVLFSSDRNVPSRIREHKASEIVA